MSTVPLAAFWLNESRSWGRWRLENKWWSHSPNRNYQLNHTTQKVTIWRSYQRIAISTKTHAKSTKLINISRYASFVRKVTALFTLPALVTPRENAIVDSGRQVGYTGKVNYFENRMQIVTVNMQMRNFRSDEMKFCMEIIEQTFPYRSINGNSLNAVTSRWL